MITTQGEISMKRYILLLLALLIAAFPTLAQDATEAFIPPQIGYYIAADENGVQQVFQQLLDGSEARQITYAESDVIIYGAAHDGLSVTYISDGQLWLQPIHTEEPEALAEVTAEQFFDAPIYSSDNQYIAYADNGVWLLDLSTRETRQLLKNVALASDGSNMGEYRLYAPEMFVLDDEGKASKLIVDIGVWEWNTAGVYDLQTGDLQELEGQVNTSLLPLSDGRVLLYGNSGVAGVFGLHIAEMDNINDYTEVLSFRSLTENTLFADQAVEVAPNVVRVFGSTIGSNPEDVTVFYFDFDVEAGQGGAVHDIVLGSWEAEAQTLAGRLSPDGSLLPVYTNTTFDDYGVITGAVELLQTESGEILAVELAEMVKLFSWQG
jgi:hypothetical protein